MFDLKKYYLLLFFFYFGSLNDCYSQSDNYLIDTIYDSFCSVIGNSRHAEMAFFSNDTSTIYWDSSTIYKVENFDKVFKLGSWPNWYYFALSDSLVFSFNPFNKSFFPKEGFEINVKRDKQFYKNFKGFGSSVVYKEGDSIFYCNLLRPEKHFIASHGSIKTLYNDKYVIIENYPDNLLYNFEDDSIIVLPDSINTMSSYGYNLYDDDYIYDLELNPIRKRQKCFSLLESSDELFFETKDSIIRWCKGVPQIDESLQKFSDFSYSSLVGFWIASDEYSNRFLLNRDGKVVSSFPYKRIYAFDENKIVAVAKDGLDVYDGSFEIIEQVRGPELNYRYLCRNRYKVKNRKSEVAVIDSSGKYIIEPLSFQDFGGEKYIASNSIGQTRHNGVQLFYTVKPYSKTESYFVFYSYNGDTICELPITKTHYSSALEPVGYDEEFLTFLTEDEVRKISHDNCWVKGNVKEPYRIYNNLKQQISGSYSVIFRTNMPYIFVVKTHSNKYGVLDLRKF